MKIRKPVVAGRFYPADKKSIVDQLELARKKELPNMNLNLIDYPIIGGVVPHAGYMFSAYEAVHFFEILKLSTEKFDTVVIVNPNHTGLGHEIAFDSHEIWETPLGEVKVDVEFGEKLGIAVSDIEQKITSPSYSFQTLGQFKKMFPFYDFYVCIGGDQLLNFHKWVLFDAILCMANLLVAERPGISYASIQKEIWEKTTFIEHKPIDVSSTQIRAQVKKGAIQPVKTSLDIRDYIVKNKLYLK